MFLSLAPNQARSDPQKPAPCEAVVISSHGSMYIKVALFTTLVCFLTRFFYKRLRSGLSTESFLAFCDFENSKFLDSFFDIFLK